MEKIIKIKNTKKSKIFWIFTGFLKVLDGLIQIFSFGTYCGQFNINYLVNSKNNLLVEKN